MKRKEYCRGFRGTGSKGMWEKIQSQKNPTERYGMSSEM